MNGWNNLPIQRKIQCSWLLLLCLLTGLCGWTAWDAMHELAVQNLEKRGVEIANHVAAIGANYLLMDDIYAANELIDQTMDANADVRYVIFSDQNNKLVAHSFDGGVPKALRQLPVAPGGTSRVLSSKEGVIHDILVPVENGAIGYVRIGMSEANSKTYLTGRLQLLALILLLAGLTAAGAGHWLARVIVRPINQLAAVADEIAAGRSDSRSRIETGGEIGKLVRAFDAMTAKLLAQSRKNEQLLAEKEVLLQQLREKEEGRDRLISKLINAQEEERKRISRELHDETSQAVTSLKVTMGVLAGDSADPVQKETLLAARDIAADVLREIRDLAVELRPPLLDDLGLAAAVRKFVQRWQQRFALPVELNVPEPDLQLEGHRAVALYRVVQESLTNVVRHAGASKVWISLAPQEEGLRLLIRDDGIGVAAEQLEQARRENRLGIYGMRERVELLGGRFAVESKAGHGVQVEVWLPLGENGGMADE